MKGGDQRVGPRKDGGPERVGGQNFALCFFPSPATISLFLLFSLNFGGVLKTNLKSRPIKTPPKFNEKTPSETQKVRNGGGKGKKKSENLGGPAEGGPVEGRGVRRKVVQGSPNQQQPQQPRTTTPNPEQVGPGRAGPLSQARFRVCVFRGWAQQHTTTHNNNNTTQQQQQ